MVVCVSGGRKGSGYTRDGYYTALTCDLVQKCALSDAQALERLAEFLLDEVRNLNAPNNIVAALSTHLGPASCTTVGRLRCIAGSGDSRSMYLALLCREPSILGATPETDGS